MVEYVDLDKYPILSLNKPEGMALVKRCREALDDDGSLCLERFIRPDVIHRMAAEVANLESFHRLQIVEPYIFVKPPADAPADHASRHRIAQDVHAVAADLIPEETMLRKVYNSEEIMTFLAAVLRIPKLYHFADYMQKLNVMYMKDGGSRAWHYDGSDFVVTLLLQPSQFGGEFEWAPFIRGANGEEHYDKVGVLSFILLFSRQASFRQEYVVFHGR